MTDYLLIRIRPARCAFISDGYCLSILLKVGYHHGYKQPLTALLARSLLLRDVAALDAGSIDE